MSPLRTWRRVSARGLRRVCAACTLVLGFLCAPRPAAGADDLDFAGVIYPTIKGIGDEFLSGAGAADQAIQKNLPIGKALVGDRADELPLPIGLTFGYSHQWEKIRVERLDASLNGSPPISLPPGSLSDIRASTNAYALTLDAWVLPFWNVFGVAAYSQGTARLTANVPPLFNGSLQVPYRVSTYGGGTTLAGGWRELITAVNLTWTTQNVNVLKSKVNVFIAAPRVGWQTSIGKTAIALWTGANYLHLSKHQYGQLVFDIPNAGPTNIDFDMDLREVGAWNAALGGRVSLGKRFDLMLDAGLGVRKSIVAALAFRF